MQRAQLAILATKEIVTPKGPRMLPDPKHKCALYMAFIAASCTACGTS